MFGSGYGIGTTVHTIRLRLPLIRQGLNRVRRGDVEGGRTSLLHTMLAYRSEAASLQKQTGGAWGCESQDGPRTIVENLVTSRADQKRYFRFAPFLTPHERLDATLRRLPRS